MPSRPTWNRYDRPNNLLVRQKRHSICLVVLGAIVATYRHVKGKPMNAKRKKVLKAVALGAGLVGLLLLPTGCLMTSSPVEIPAGSLGAPVTVVAPSPTVE
jgi:hypothetical protein